MNVAEIWIIILSIATPVAGIVGFAVQLRQVRGANLENRKLIFPRNSKHQRQG
jgi:hypothetical protein